MYNCKTNLLQYWCRGTYGLFYVGNQNTSVIFPCLHLVWIRFTLLFLGAGYLAWKWIRISLESWMGCPDGSGTKTKLYELVSQTACISGSIFGTKHTHSRVPGLKGEGLFFLIFQVFLVCLPIVDQYEFVYTNLYYKNSHTLIYM